MRIDYFRLIQCVCVCVFRCACFHSHNFVGAVAAVFTLMMPLFTSFSFLFTLVVYSHTLTTGSRHFLGVVSPHLILHHRRHRQTSMSRSQGAHLNIVLRLVSSSSLSLSLPPKHQHTIASNATTTILPRAISMCTVCLCEWNICVYDLLEY